MTTIFVADDHDLVRMGIIRMLTDIAEFSVVGEASSGEEAVRGVRDLAPNIVLMDLKMPGIGGLEATKKLTAGGAQTKVIAVTSVSDDLFAEKLMQAGALGYVTKDAGFEEIIEAIRKVSSGRHYISPSIAQQIALKTCNKKEVMSPFECLSGRELQTAIAIAQGTKANAIAESLCVSPKTINSYRYRIFEKLAIHSDVELALLAVKYNILDLENIA